MALAILSFVMSVLLVSFSDIADRASAARSQAFAESLATSLMDRVGNDVPLVPGTYEFPEENGYRPAISIVPFGADADRENWPIAAYTVSVTIAWGSGGTHDYTIRSLRLGPANDK